MGTPNRAIVFVDGSNWYHSLRAVGIAESEVDYRKLCEKLLGPRTWLELPWYVGRVDQTHEPRRYAEQRRRFDALEKCDARISLHWGRIERRPVANDAAEELERYLGRLRTRLESAIYGALYDIARRHQQAFAYVEKAVDVMLAVDMVSLATADRYDTAYLLSADGDYTHAQTPHETAASPTPSRVTTRRFRAPSDDPRRRPECLSHTLSVWPV